MILDPRHVGGAAAKGESPSMPTLFARAAARPLQQVGVALLALALALTALALSPARATAQPDDAPTFADRLGLDREELLAAKERTRLNAFSALAEPWPDDARPGALLVTTAPGGVESLRAQSLAGDLGEGLPSIPFRAATVLSDQVLRLEVEPGTESVAAAALRARADVVDVEADVYRRVLAVPNDPGYGAQFAHQLTGVEAAWDVTTSGAGVRVGVIDSGVVAEHPDLAGLVVDQVDAQTGEVVAGQTDNDVCSFGHGTWVAGIMGALGNNGTDVAGVTWGGLEIVDVNFVQDSPETCAVGAGSDSALIAGIEYAVAADVDIINMSLGGIDKVCPTALQTAVDGARGAGITVVAASGNSGAGTIGVPASCNGVISVSAVGPGSETTEYASTNDFVDITAPSGADLNGDGDASGPDEGVVTTSWWSMGERTPATIGVQGTSFSAPYITGVAALLKGLDPELTPDQVEAVLEATATDLGDEGRDPEHGAGLVQAGAAVQLVASGAELPALEPDPAFAVGSRVGVRYGGPVEIQRVSAGTGTTEPITQAVAMSQALFPTSEEGEAEAPAPFAVLARGDEFADALAGSSITLASAPLLFSNSDTGLAPETAEELQRVLAPGSPVLVLGGEVALPAQVDADLQALGFQSQRLAGSVREETAVAIANALTSLNAEIGYTAPSVVLASSYVWYDAITAGSLAAGEAAPVLLTGAEELAPVTRAALEQLNPEKLYVVGGEVRVEAQTRQQAAEAAAVPVPIVLAGAARDETAVLVAAEIERLVDDLDLAIAAAVTLNLTRDDGWAHGLSSSPFLGSVPSVFVPVLGEDGSQYSAATVDYFQGFGISGIIPGDVDLVSEQSAADLEVLLSTAPEDGGTPPPTEPPPTEPPPTEPPPTEPPPTEPPPATSPIADVTLEIDNTTAQPGQNVVVTATATDANGAVVEGAALTFEVFKAAPPAGSRDGEYPEVFSQTALTDAEGRFQAGTLVNADETAVYVACVDPGATPEAPGSCLAEDSNTLVYAGDTVQNPEPSLEGLSSVAVFFSQV